MYMSPPSGFKTKEEYAKYMREYRERKKADEFRAKKISDHALKDKLSLEDWDETIKILETMAEENATFRNVLQPQLRNLEHIKIALGLFHDVILIAHDPNLSDGEVKERIQNFRFEVPPYFMNILRELSKEKHEKELVKVE